MSTRRYYRFGLIGYPLGHSRSPEMQEAALRACGLCGEYKLYPVSPGQDSLLRIANLVDQLRTYQIHGLNITIPHKQTALGLVDCLTPTAQAIGAVNTLVRLADGRILGENTDVPGFLHDLTRNQNIATGQALVLGAGGSARAIVYALLQAGWQVRIAARNVAQAQTLVDSIPKGKPSIPGAITCMALERSALAVIASTTSVTLLVNTTPVGMAPDVSQTPWPEDILLPEQAVVYDLIYNPWETRFLRQARTQGLVTMNGAGMLAAQGALAFSLWTTMPPPFTIMRNALAAPAQHNSQEPKTT